MGTSWGWYWPITRSHKNGPVRQETLDNLAEILNYVANLWERTESKRRELTRLQRVKLDSLRDQIIGASQGHCIKIGLKLICTTAQEMFESTSGVVYPLAEDGVYYQVNQIAQVGLDAVKFGKEFATPLRQGGLFGHITANGESGYSQYRRKQPVFP